MLPFLLVLWCRSFMHRVSFLWILYVWESQVNFVNFWCCQSGFWWSWNLRRRSHCAALDDFILCIILSGSTVWSSCHPFCPLWLLRFAKREEKSNNRPKCESLHRDLCFICTDTCQYRDSLLGGVANAELQSFVRVGSDTCSAGNNFLIWNCTMQLLELLFM